MAAHLGFFADFKGSDTVLWAGSANDVACLLAKVEQFACSTDDSLPIHAHTVIAKDHPVKLFLFRSSPPTQGNQPNQFHWPIAPENLFQVTSELAALASSCKGHQYFVLAEHHTQLIVSVGEYPDAWWGTDG